MTKKFLLYGGIAAVALVVLLRSKKASAAALPGATPPPAKLTDKAKKAINWGAGAGNGNGTVTTGLDLQKKAAAVLAAHSSELYLAAADYNDLYQRFERGALKTDAELLAEAKRLSDARRPKKSNSKGFWDKLGDSTGIHAKDLGKAALAAAGIAGAPFTGGASLAATAAAAAGSLKL